MTKLAELSERRILVVEDEIIVALNLEAELSAAGAAVVGPAHTLGEAMALASADMDAAVLDINIGDDKVWPLAHALRARGVPFVFASANCAMAGGGLEQFPEATRIDKPIDFRRLTAALAAVTASACR